MSNFTIPFEIGGAAAHVREVELFVSQDQGKRWTLVARQPVETGKFAFRANGDGEYWFVFRTIALTGNANSMPTHPELRVLVDTKNPAIAPPSSLNVSGPVVPPRPGRFRPENIARPQPTQPTQPAQPATVVESQTNEPVAAPESARIERPGQILAPKFPGFDPAEAASNCEEELLSDLLSGMSSFMDVQPVFSRSTSSKQVATDRAHAAPNTPVPPNVSVGAPAGSIVGISLNNAATRPQIVVRWNTGDEQLRHEAQIDVLRSSMPENTTEREWLPIAINLPNSGEYWWYLSPEDLKPFYLALRIRSLHGGSNVDVTQSRIEIDPQLAVFLSQRP